jgi:hypothetical protein
MGDGWQARGANGWERAAPANTRQQAPAAGVPRPGGAGGGASAGQIRQGFDSADVNRAAVARQRGAVREANRPSLPATRPAGQQPQIRR